jgi:hypothetical protein
MNSLIKYSLLILFVSTISAFAHPNHPHDSLSIAANNAYAENKWAEAAYLYAEAIEHGVNDPSTVYNCACAFARAEQPDSAFHYLDLAISKDFTNVQHLQKDTDLISLYSDSRWPKLIVAMKAAQQAYLNREGINAELFYMMKEDQAARQLPVDSIRWDSISVKDNQRLMRVKEMAEAGVLKVSEDFFNAALICQHGADSSDYKLANTLARQAVELDSTDSSAKWLVASAWDRYLQKTGRPQIYGTQFVLNNKGQWTLEPLDSLSISDTERARWNVPSLSEARKHVEDLNKKEK